jgi:PBP1b-binding outer membrane lipoprotein LpoB
MKLKKIISIPAVILLLISCTGHKEVKKEINKQEQIYQSEKAFKELEKEN